MRPTLPAAGLAAFLAAAGTALSAHASCWVYFGTSATDARRGIYLSRLDEDSGALSPATRVADKSDSVFFAFSPDRRHLYGLAEVPGAAGRAEEAIETYAVDGATGRLEAVGEQVAGGPEACHISVDPSGRCVLTANYDGHYVEVFPVRADATVGPRSCLVRHSGSGPNRSRQESAHPHSINVDPTGRFAIVPCTPGVLERVLECGGALAPAARGDRRLAQQVPRLRHAAVVAERFESRNRLLGDARDLLGRRVRVGEDPEELALDQRTKLESPIGLGAGGGECLLERALGRLEGARLHQSDR